MTTQENSVMVALGELATIERARVEDERRADAARARAREERIEGERAARERAAQQAELERARVVAEADAKVRVGLELQRDRSLDELRLHIAAVQAEREAMREALLARVEAASAPQGPRRGPWALAFGLSSVVAAALAGALVLQQQSIELARADASSSTIETAPWVVAAAESERDDVEVALATAETAPPALEEAPAASAPPRSRIRGGRDRERLRETQADARETDLERALGLEQEDDDDVLGERFLQDATRHR